MCPAQGATGGWVMLGLGFKWFPLCEFSLFETPFEYTVEMRNRFKELDLKTENHAKLEIKPWAFGVGALTPRP